VLFDAHLHAFGRPFLAALAGEAAAIPGTPGLPAVLERLRLDPPDEDPAAHARAWLRELDRNAVAGACLIASHPAEAEHVAAMVAAASGRRFVGASLVNPLAIDAAERIPTIVERLGLRALLLMPTLHRYHLAEQRWLLDYANRNDLVLIVQCGLLDIPLRTAFGLPRRADPRFGRPLDLAATADAHPRIAFVIPHFGAGLLDECLLLGRACANVWIDTAGANGWLASLGLDLRGAFARALAAVGPGRILFGTDSGGFPRGWRRDVADAQREACAALGLGHEAVAAIFSGNARRLHGLD
jgi:predicted TIM-barrel fold metal-dependent hydrolase